jgi:hypothetical protein
MTGSPEAPRQRDALARARAAIVALRPIDSDPRVVELARAGTDPATLDMARRICAAETIARLDLVALSVDLGVEVVRRLAAAGDAANTAELFRERVVGFLDSLKRTGDADPGHGDAAEVLRVLMGAKRD